MLVVTVSIWNYRHHIDDGGQRWFTFVPEQEWAEVLSRLAEVADNVEDAAVRFVGEGVDPSAPRATFVGGAELDPARAKSAVCLVETTLEALPALREAAYELLVALHLFACWFIPAELGVVHQFESIPLA